MSVNPGFGGQSFIPAAQNPQTALDEERGLDPGLK